MSHLTPIPAEHRAIAHDAITAARAELQRLGQDEPDGSVFAAFHRALYRPLLDAHERAVLIAAGQKLRDHAFATFEPTGPEGTWHRATIAAARRIEPEPAEGEMQAAIAELLGGMAALRAQGVNVIAVTDPRGRPARPVTVDPTADGRTTPPQTQATDGNRG